MGSSGLSEGSHLNIIKPSFLANLFCPKCANLPANWVAFLSCQALLSPWPRILFWS